MTLAEIAERDERIAELTRRGHTAKQIAAELGISTRTVVRARARTGTARRAPARFTEAEIGLAESLLDDGASYSEVARTLHRDQTNISRRFPGRSVWAKCSSSEYSALMSALKSLPAVITRRTAS